MTVSFPIQLESHAETDVGGEVEWNKVSHHAVFEVRGPH